MTAELSVWEQVERSPQMARVAFDRLDEALNMVLPGSDTHERYKDGNDVGLAAVIGRDYVGQGDYNPFLYSSLTPLRFMADNRQTHPEAWEPQEERDLAILGRAIPEGMGRFTVFALAKINTLTYNIATSSCEKKVTIEFGQIGLAGGIRLRQSLVGASGLWEVHDHMAGHVLVQEIDREENTDTTDRTADDLAEEIEAMVDAIQSFHPDIEPTDLSRSQIVDLVGASDSVIAQVHTNFLRRLK